MTCDEYIAQLGALLAGQMPSRQIDGILHYYEEYFREVGPEGEAALMEELGTPAELAAQILGRPAGSESAGSYGYYPPPSQEAPPSPLVSLCLMLTAGLLILISLGLLVGLVAGGGACVVAGGILAVGGVLAFLPFAPAFFLSFALRLCLLGSGLLVAGLGLLLLIGGIAAFRGIWRAAFRLLAKARGGDLL